MVAPRMVAPRMVAALVSLRRWRPIRKKKTFRPFGGAHGSRFEVSKTEALFFLQVLEMSLQKFPEVFSFGLFFVLLELFSE
jgi:hypothetical protein